MQNEGLTVGAVCVYPSRVADCVKSLKACNGSDIPIASVATGFPTGQVGVMAVCVYSSSVVHYIKCWC